MVTNARSIITKDGYTCKNGKDSEYDAKFTKTVSSSPHQ